MIDVLNFYYLCVWDRSEAIGRLIRGSRQLSSSHFFKLASHKSWAMTNKEFLESISLDGEMWKDVVGYEGLYAVSNLGRVVSYERYVVGYRRQCMRINKARVMSPRKSKTYNGGYYMVELKNDCKTSHKYIHRLVATHFIENNEPKRKEVDHIDGNTLNNRVDNLRWVTHSENQRNENTIKKFSLSHIGKQMYARWKPIVGVSGNQILKFETLKEAKKFGFHPSAICRCCKGLQSHHKGYQWMYLSDYENLKSVSQRTLKEVGD